MNYTEQLKKQIETLYKNEIRLDIHPALEQIRTGQSKFGGKPHLPGDFQWYYYETEGLYGEVKNRPLSFLAQINCQEVHSLDGERLLPEEGMLYFFYEMDSMSWGYDPKHQGCARVYYYSGDMEELIPTEFPEDLEEEYILPELAVTFERTGSLPDYREAELFLDMAAGKNSDGYDAYEKVLEELGYGGSDICSKLLGYADLIQNEALAECEMVSNGIYIGGGWPKMSDEEQDELMERAREWILLFQLDSVVTDDFELMFGDCGCIYFYIRKQDLKECRFDRAWLILQCY